MSETVRVVLSFVAGIALFLFGVETMAMGLKPLATQRAKRWLSRSTSNPVAGVLTGTVATVILDSSSLVGILTVALIDAEMLSLAQGIGVVMGANIGTTASSQLIALQVGDWAAVPMALGLLAVLVGQKHEKAQAWGRVALGLGVLLFALEYIGDVAEPFKDDPTLKRWMETLRNPLAGATAGAVITGIIQSSSAMVGMVVILAERGTVPLQAAVAMMLGAEIGTTLDVMVSTVGRKGTAVRLGIFQLLFNLVTVLVALPLIDPLISLATSFGSGPGRHLANAHVVFNVAGVLVALPFVGIFARLLERVARVDASSSEEPTVAESE